MWSGIWIFFLELDRLNNIKQDIAALNSKHNMNESFVFTALRLVNDVVFIHLLKENALYDLQLSRSFMIIQLTSTILLLLQVISFCDLPPQRSICDHLDLSSKVLNTRHKLQHKRTSQSTVPNKWVVFTISQEQITNLEM